MCTHRARLKPYAGNSPLTEVAPVTAMTNRNDTAETPPDLINHLRQQIIGRETHIPTPYGSEPLVYCDHTASGRGLASIEKVISRDVLPHYANTHSEASHTGRHTGQLREWARQLSLKGHHLEINAKSTGHNRASTSQRDFSVEVYESLNGCLACKACTSTCPIKVDIPESVTTIRTPAKGIWNSS